MATKLEILKAMHGDALILTVEEEGECFNMVIDSGPAEAYYDVVKPVLDKLDHIDLFVLTHWHDDHCGGLTEWLMENEENARKVKEFWVNCAEGVEYSNSNTISAYTKDRDLKDFFVKESKLHKDWNISWSTEIIASHSFHSDSPLVDIEVIAPSTNARKTYIDEYHKAISKQNYDSVLAKPLDELAKLPMPMNKQDVNNASIAFIVRTRDKSFLMLGDVQEKDVYTYLTEKHDYSKNKKLAVDFVKMPHHGSKYNISNRLLDIIDTENYIFTTDGGDGNSSHPDRMTVARILCRESRDRLKQINLIFNYSQQDFIDNRAQFLTQEEIEDKSLNFKFYPDRTEV
jgi:beta-lactamase superfamily II metal-dependent hydrolase